MSNENIRREFQSAFRAEYSNSTNRDMTTKQYEDPVTQVAWWAWKNSRESLVIELPPKWPLQTSADHAANEMREQCVSAIEYGAGLKVKP